MQMRHMQLPDTSPVSHSNPIVPLSSSDGKSLGLPLAPWMNVFLLLAHCLAPSGLGFFVKEAASQDCGEDYLKWHPHHLFAPTSHLLDRSLVMVWSGSGLGYCVSWGLESTGESGTCLSWVLVCLEGVGFSQFSAFLVGEAKSLIQLRR